MKNLIVPTLGEKPLGLLRRCGGWYECPKDAAGKRFGPLVGYAGRDDQGRQFVGDVYANFAAIEEHHHALDYIAEQFVDGEEYWPEGADSICETFCAMPLGGMLLGSALARAFNMRFIFAEKKVTVVATTDTREKSVLFFGRHSVRAGEQVAIVEDIANNLSTTEEAIRLIQQQGGKVTAIFCFLNRSLKADRVFEMAGVSFPIFALVRQPIQQYTQDDSAVAADIANGNVIWKPKNEWARLEEAMAHHSQQLGEVNWQAGGQ